MQSIRTARLLTALVVAVLALFVAVSGSALAASNGHHGPTASAAKKHHHKKPKKPKKPAPPKGPFVAKDAGATAIGTGPDDTVVETLSLPRGSNYVVTAKAELGNNAASANSVSCQLLENNNPIDSGNEDLTPLATFSRTITLTSTSTGGAIKLVCQATKGAQARNRVITAVVSS